MELGIQPQQKNIERSDRVEHAVIAALERACSLRRMAKHL
jgi:tRNA(Arg) A34 adenosine deaminase TadA